MISVSFRAMSDLGWSVDCAMHSCKGVAGPRHRTRPEMIYPASERLDVHLAELHDALAVLERDMAAREFAVLGAVDRLGAVERHREFRALGGDLVGVPFAAGLERD